MESLYPDKIEKQEKIEEPVNKEVVEQKSAAFLFYKFAVMRQIAKVKIQADRTAKTNVDHGGNQNDKRRSKTKLSSFRD